MNAVKVTSWFCVLAALVAMPGRATNITDPTVSVAGTSTSQQTVSVTVTDSAGPIYYTTDGTNPTSSSKTITSGSTLLIAQNAVLKVQAIQSATITSNLVTAQYTLAAQVSAGDSHTLSIRNDGTVWAWGDNSAGELGNGTLTSSSQPTEVMINGTTPLTGVVAVAAGTQESFAVDNEGHVWGWGLNTSGQLGTGGTANLVYPLQVSGLTGAVAVASSGSHTLVLTGGGALWAWGANESGQVGNGDTSSWVTTPVQVLSPSGQTGPYIQNIVAVAAGANHSLAMDNAGHVFAWGDNAYGQLGNGDTSLTLQPGPVYVQTSGSPFTGAVGIAAAANNSYALKSAGTAWAWGDDSIGELGNGQLLSPGPSTVSPVQVAGLTSLAGLSNESALAANGNLWTWGENSNGRLGVGFANGYAEMPLNVSLSGSLPTITITAGDGQSVTGGVLSGAFTVTVTDYGSPAANTWVYFAVPTSEGSLVLSPTGTQFSPIIGVETNSQGVATVYLQGGANTSGPVQIIASSGSSQTTLSAIVALAGQAIATDTPTMPEWMLIILAGLLFLVAVRRKSFLARL